MKRKPEVWKKIEDYSKYSVSSHGRIRNDETGKLIAIHYRKDYARVSIYSDEGPRKTHSLHLIVAYHFVENPEGLDEVNHKNGVKSDNYYENLEWVTHSENMTHAHQTGLRRRTAGEENPFNKLEESTVHKICELFQNGRRIFQVRKELNLEHLSHACIGNIYHRKNWTDVSKDYKW
jgi:hypothetical protein